MTAKHAVKRLVTCGIIFHSNVLSKIRYNVRRGTKVSHWIEIRGGIAHLHNAHPMGAIIVYTVQVNDDTFMFPRSFRKRVPHEDSSEVWNTHLFTQPHQVDIS